MAKDFVPSTDTEFYRWQLNLLNYLIENAELWGIPEAELTKLKTLRSAFEQAYALYVDPATRTHPVTIQKQETRDAYEKGIRSLLKAYVTYNTLVTDKDRANMGLPIHKTTRTPVPPPSTVPEAEVELSSPAVLHVHFHDKGAERKAKPTGVHGVEIAWAVLDEKPLDWNALTNSAFDTRSPYKFVFKGEQRGKKMYFALRWENTRGDKGDWSDIYEAVIP